MTAFVNNIQLFICVFFSGQKKIIAPIYRKLNFILYRMDILSVICCINIQEFTNRKMHKHNYTKMTKF